MTDVSIKYNPYLIETSFLINGEKPKENSSLRFEKQRLQEWVEKLPEILKDECDDSNFKITFTGTSMDFEDLKMAFKMNEDIVDASVEHFEAHNADEAEHAVDKIFDDIQHGPLDELRDNSIVEAFDRAKNQQFEINVIATMSSGKSTLINALLGKQLLPARNEATTAKITKIINEDQDTYSLKAFDLKGDLIEDINNVTIKETDAFNDREDVSLIEIKGRIPFVSTVGMQLVFVDTPGPNNAREHNHQVTTYKMLEDSDKSLVLYVLDGAQLGINDSETLLNDVCDCMAKGGKQTRDRYLFVVNKMDVYKKFEADRIEGALDKEVEHLQDKGIPSPCLFPVSSLAALELRTKEADYQALPPFRSRSLELEAYHFDSYYQHNHLPLAARKAIETRLSRAQNEDDKIEVYTGIVSIEQAIALYINKYAKATKIRDLVDSFNFKLAELAVTAHIQKLIRDDKTERKKLMRKITELKESITTAKNAIEYNNKIDKLDFTQEAKTAIGECVNSVLKDVNNMLASTPDSLKSATAKKMGKDITTRYNSSVTKMVVEIDKIFKDTYNKTLSSVINEYKNHLTELELKVSMSDLSFKPIDLVNHEFHELNLNRIIASNTITETSYHTVHKTKTIQVKSQKGKGAKLGAGIGAGVGIGLGVFTGGLGLLLLPTLTGIGAGVGAITSKGKHTETIPDDELVARTTETVNMREVANRLLVPMQKKIRDLKKTAIENVEKQSETLKTTLKGQIEKINDLLAEKLNNLSNLEAGRQATEAEIAKKEENLIWLNEIQNRVNKIINF